MPMKMALALMALVTLTACDRRGDAAAERDRADRTYRAAMSDYQSGRINQALEGLKKACTDDPANASARFQFACLLQDVAKDYAGAYCAYHEYLLQRPQSEKSKLAKDRMAVCEREMAKALTDRFAPEAVQKAVRDAQETRAAQSKAEAECTKLKAELESTQQALAKLRQENNRLKDLMRDEAGDVGPDTSHADDVAEARALVADEAIPNKSASDEIAEAKKLVEDDTAAVEPPPMLSQSSDAKAKRAAAQAAEQTAAQAAAKSAGPYPHETRPETYVVQEGDTLYKIAIRFYGRASAWNRIRAANKATISTDGRLKIGQKIVLPAEE